ncbi:MAG TPA: hypothetical protein IAC11_03145 [Candidatus Limiplasma pullicola]|nr:hypothetical protein [Candidatus Limiplasma pullicola]
MKTRFVSGVVPAESWKRGMSSGFFSSRMNPLMLFAVFISAHRKTGLAQGNRLGGIP